jgi:hypothetical protein
MLHRTLPILLICATAALADAPPAAAKELFERFQAAVRAGDQSVVSLFSDDWKLVLAYIDPAGKRRTITNPGEDFPDQDMRRRGVMDPLKEGGTDAVLSDVRYAPEGDGIRINFVLTDANQPSVRLSLLVQPTDTRKWLISEFAVEAGRVEGEELAKFQEQEALARRLREASEAP